MTEGGRRKAFWFYAALLFVGTHYPNARLPDMVIPRPDILVHLALFTTWSALLAWSGLLGPPHLPRTAGRVILVGLVYAAFDEMLQAIPVLHRHAAVDDYLANGAGILLGSVIVMLFARSRLEPRTKAS